METLTTISCRKILYTTWREKCKNTFEARFIFTNQKISKYCGDWMAVAKWYNCTWKNAHGNLLIHWLPFPYCSCQYLNHLPSNCYTLVWIDASKSRKIGIVYIGGLLDLMIGKRVMHIKLFNPHLFFLSFVRFMRSS